MFNNNDKRKLKRKQYNKAREHNNKIKENIKHPIKNNTMPCFISISNKY